MSLAQHIQKTFEGRATHKGLLASMVACPSRGAFFEATQVLLSKRSKAHGPYAVYAVRPTRQMPRNNGLAKNPAVATECRSVECSEK
jgi:hypothetical protein